MVSNIWPDNNVCSYSQQATEQSFKLNHLLASRSYPDRYVQNKIMVTRTSKPYGRDQSIF